MGGGMFKKVIFDVDQTLVDTTCLERERQNRNWSLVQRSVNKANN